MYQCRYRIKAAATAPDGTVAATSTTSTTIHDPDNVDCIETQDDCTAACHPAAERNYTVLTLTAKRGTACTGPTDCRPGDGACPAAAAAALKPPNTGLSGGAVAGIIILILLVVGAIAWWVGFANRSSGSGARQAAGLRTELELEETKNNTMDMQENPLAAGSTAVDTVMNAMFVEDMNIEA